MTQKNSTYKVVVKQSQTIQKSYVTIEAELLDETRKPFFGFSGELFYEQGIDRNGPWAESNDEVASRVNIENPGKYLLLLKAKSSFKSPETKLTVIIYKVRGSFIPVLLLGVILLIVGLISNKLMNPRGTE